MPVGERESCLDASSFVEDARVPCLLCYGLPRPPLPALIEIP